MEINILNAIYYFQSLQVEILDLFIGNKTVTIVIPSDTPLCTIRQILEFLPGFTTDFGMGDDADVAEIAISAEIK